jgi:uncharacterized membrane protein
MGFEQTMDVIARGVEIIGIVTLVLGLAAALVRPGLVLTGGPGVKEVYRIVRTVFGRSILLGLEFLLAADIIRTVAVQPSLENVAVLGLIVLIRTFLSSSLEVEIDGRWPWQHAFLGRTAPLPASRVVSDPRRGVSWQLDAAHDGIGKHGRTLLCWVKAGVSLEEPVELAGDVADQAASDFAVGLALGAPPLGKYLPAIRQQQCLQTPCAPLCRLDSIAF